MAMTSWDIDDERREERQRRGDAINKKAAEIYYRATKKDYSKLTELEKNPYREQAAKVLG